MSNLYVLKVSFQNHSLLVGFKFRYIDIALKVNGIKEAIKKSTKVEKRGNKAQEKCWREVFKHLKMVQNNKPDYDISDENYQIMDYTC